MNDTGQQGDEASSSAEQRKSPAQRSARRGRDQYSSASMMVSTRVVFDGSAGSGEPNRISEVVCVDFEKELPGQSERAEVVLAVRVIVRIELGERRNPPDH